MNRFYSVILKNAYRLPVYMPRLHWMSRHPERYSWEARYAFAMKCVRWVADAGKITVEAFGLEHVPEGGCLICPNHQDKFDPLAVWLTYPGRTSVVIDDAACHRPIICDFIPLVEGVKLQKGSMKAMYRMTECIGEKLRADRPYILFPEGQYEVDHRTLGPFMPGCFRSAMQAEKPILPVAVIDSFHAFAENQSGPVEVQVHYLEPILPEQYKGLRTREVAGLVRERIQAALDEFQK